MLEAALCVCVCVVGLFFFFVSSPLSRGFKGQQNFGTVLGRKFWFLFLYLSSLYMHVLLKHAVFEDLVLNQLQGC